MHYAVKLTSTNLIAQAGELLLLRVLHGHKKVLSLIFEHPRFGLALPVASDP